MLQEGILVVVHNQVDMLEVDPSKTVVRAPHHDAQLQFPRDEQLQQHVPLLVSYCDCCYRQLPLRIYNVLDCIVP